MSSGAHLSDSEPAEKHSVPSYEVYTSDPGF